jgi:ornithine carbamoyltransferase
MTGVVRLEQVSNQAARKLLATARALGRAERDGHRDQSLRGKNLALVALSPGPAAALFVAAVEQLGATASQVADALLTVNDPHELQRLAHLLDRLYDAVECQGVSAAIVQRLSDIATVPVFGGIACDTHPTATLASALINDDGAADADARRWILQAALLITVA